VFRYLILSECGRPLTRSTPCIASSLTSTSMCPGMSAGKHSISTSRSTWSRMAAGSFHADRTPSSSREPLRAVSCPGNPLHVDVDERSLIGSRCQSTIIAWLWRFHQPLRRKSCCGPSRRKESGKSAWGPLQRPRIVTRAIQNCRDLTRYAHTACSILVELALTGLCIHYFRHFSLFPCRHGTVCSAPLLGQPSAGGS